MNEKIPAWRIFAKSIIKILEQGLLVDDDAFHFLESTYSIQSLAELEHALNNPDSCDTDTILELLFYPDQQARMLVEPLLLETPPDVDDEARAISYLQSQKAKARLVFSKTKEIITLPVPNFALSLFIKRLGVAIQIPEKLAAAAAAIPGPQAAIALSVLFRGSGIFWTPELVDFFLRTIKINKAAPDFLEIMEAALILVREIPFGHDPAQYLEQKRKWCESNLQQAKKSESDLADKNMETRIMSGIRPSYIDENRLNAQLALIDRILHALQPLPDF